MPLLWYQDLAGNVIRAGVNVGAPRKYSRTQEALDDYEWSSIEGGGGIRRKHDPISP